MTAAEYFRAHPWPWTDEQAKEYTNLFLVEFDEYMTEFNAGPLSPLGVTDDPSVDRERLVDEARD